MKCEGVSMTDLEGRERSARRQIAGMGQHSASLKRYLYPACAEDTQQR